MAALHMKLTLVEMFPSIKNNILKTVNDKFFSSLVFKSSTQTMVLNINWDFKKNTVHKPFFLPYIWIHEPLAYNTLPDPVYI